MAARPDCPLSSNFPKHPSGFLAQEDLELLGRLSEKYLGDAAEEFSEADALPSLARLALLAQSSGSGMQGGEITTIVAMADAALVKLERGKAPRMQSSSHGRKRGLGNFLSHPAIASVLNEHSLSLGIRHWMDMNHGDFFLRSGKPDEALSCYSAAFGKGLAGKGGQDKSLFYFEVASRFEAFGNKHHAYEMGLEAIKEAKSGSVSLQETAIFLSRASGMFGQKGDVAIRAAFEAEQIFKEAAPAYKDMLAIAGKEANSDSGAEVLELIVRSLYSRKDLSDMQKAEICIQSNNGLAKVYLDSAYKQAGVKTKPQLLRRLAILKKKAEIDASKTIEFERADSLAKLSEVEAHAGNNAKAASLISQAADLCIINGLHSKGSEYLAKKLAIEIGSGSLEKAGETAASIFGIILKNKDEKVEVMLFEALAAFEKNDAAGFAGTMGAYPGLHEWFSSFKEKKDLGKICKDFGLLVLHGLRFQRNDQKNFSQTFEIAADWDDRLKVLLCLEPTISAHAVKGDRAPEWFFAPVGAILNNGQVQSADTSDMGSWNMSLNERRESHAYKRLELRHPEVIGKNMARMAEHSGECIVSNPGVCAFYVAEKFLGNEFDVAISEKTKAFAMQILEMGYPLFMAGEGGFYRMGIENGRLACAYKKTDYKEILGLGRIEIGEDARKKWLEGVLPKFSKKVVCPFEYNLFKSGRMGMGAYEKLSSYSGTPEKNEWIAQGVYLNGLGVKRIEEVVSDLGGRPDLEKYVHNLAAGQEKIEDVINKTDYAGDKLLAREFSRRLMGFFLHGFADSASESGNDGLAGEARAIADSFVQYGSYRQLMARRSGKDGAFSLTYGDLLLMDDEMNGFVRRNVYIDMNQFPE